jgi:DnaJ-class molecular chaperone
MSLRPYAKLLGLAPNESGLISKKDIRTAYITFAKQFHPDKGATDSSDFVQRKEAYDKLCEACGNNEFVFIGSEFQFEALMSLVQGLASKLKKHFDERPVPSAPIQPIVIKLRVSIKELYVGAWKKIKYKYLSADGSLQSDEVYVCLESYQEKYVFPDKGDVKKDGCRTNLHVILDIETDPLLYVDTILTKYDVCMEFAISLYDYYYRDAFYIEYFGEMVTINYSPGLTLQTIIGKGLPYLSTEGEPIRGDLVVFFKLVLPTSSPETLKPMFEKYFGLPTAASKSEAVLHST